MLIKRRGSDLLMLLLLLVGLIALFSPILFTTKIVRAPDILNEFYWGVYNAYGKPLWSMLRVDLATADWNPYINSGHSNDGGMASMQFVYPYRLIFGLIPAPASVAWFMVLHLFAGGVGTYLYCRLVGCSRIAALFGGLLFAFCTENASLINAGHVMKIATIAHAPWVFYFIEKGFRTDRLFAFLCAGLVLTLQFFNTHWQIAFYTCLGVAVYGALRLGEQVMDGEPAIKTGHTLLLGLVMVLFFLSASAISLAPLANWSKDTNRGVHSGANQGKGGLQRDEAMMWSLPPEETLALVVPGLFGLSRQEGGDLPRPDQTYYWGRMFFTQTASYFGLLPWLLLPLPLMLRNDRVTKAALVAVVGGILFSMGKYTPFYQFLYDFLPGISRFRVPKMMLFITAFGLAVLTARGIDLLKDPELPGVDRIQRWVWWLLAFPLVLAIMLGAEKLFGVALRDWMMELLVRPTRYQSGVGLVSQRWFTIERETGIALALASLSSLVLLGIVRRKLAAGVGIAILLVLLAGDLWRVNSHFLVLTNPPNRAETAASPSLVWIKTQEPVARGKKHEVPEYRALLMGNTDPMSYASAGVPVLFTANAVQKRRWQEYLDALSLQSRLPDIMNVRWLVADEKLYEENQGHFGDRYPVVFRGGNEVVLENRQVLPKAWLVSQIKVETDPLQRLKQMQDLSFDPSRTALVESVPPFTLSPAPKPGEVLLQQYANERLRLSASVNSNSLLVLGEKYHKGWKAQIDGKPAEIVPVNHILRGVYLTPGKHTVEFRFDPLPFKIGKWLTLGSFALFGVVAVREWWLRRREHGSTV
ncbi:YfhO family protein [Trichlorobacter lovleyi]|uniref:YfhO family protein n=1 Tax=Trichlorobacter lovleyi TaxID=313985 RepID=UPI0023EFDAEC|nr:YfhO family protein [Trichlorobacter lovleyi]